MICAHAVSTIIPPPSTIIFRIDIAHIYKKDRSYLPKNILDEEQNSFCSVIFFLCHRVLKIGGVIEVWLVYMASKENHVFPFAEHSMGIFKI
jgi:hypothetical protein